MAKKLSKVYRVLVYALPAMLFFSYYPVIGLGASEAMNFELSLPLIWLVLFDLVGLVMMMKQKVLIKGLQKKWVWLLFPAFLTLSIIWSANATRGVLTMGILWLLYFAIYTLFNLKGEIKNDEFKARFWKVFFASTLVVCAWCFVQCILDLVGVPRECSLMCAGCTYRSFGFPHPNGFAVEPQFMGNLLLAPSMVLAWFMLQKKKLLKRRTVALLLFAVAATLFLTFSRGAIYAFGVGMIFMSSFVVGMNRKEWKGMIKRVAAVWGLIIVAFVFTLNVQGVMAEVSSTNDTYFGGISKVLNHMSLGIIDIRPVEKPVENFEEEDREEAKEDAEFDGYVTESTEIRLKMNDIAIKLWSKDFRTIMFGVGIGGAGQALYNNGLSEWPKEIVQNQYISLLLETGLVGVALLILTLVLVIWGLLRQPQGGVVLSMVVAYGITLIFFAGLPNALQIYLLPVLMTLVV